MQHTHPRPTPDEGVVKYPKWYFTTLYQGNNYFDVKRQRRVIFKVVYMLYETS